MKKLILYLAFILLPIISYSQEVIRPLIGADLLEGKGAAHFIDTTSTDQSKNGKLTLNDSLRLSDLATPNLTVLSPDSNGDIDSTETSDISVITIDTLDVNYIGINGGLDAYQADGTTSLYYHEYIISAFSTSTGASGATLTAPTANTLGGYQLDVNTEQLYYSTHVEADWDGTTDITLEVWWEVNEAAADDGTVDLQLICYYKGDHETANKTQTVEVAHTITGNKAQFAQHETVFTINFDEGGNVVDALDIFSFILNLETDTSECDDIIINYAELKYTTTKPAPVTN